MSVSPALNCSFLPTLAKIFCAWAASRAQLLGRPRRALVCSRMCSLRLAFRTASSPPPRCRRGACVRGGGKQGRGEGSARVRRGVGGEGRVYGGVRTEGRV